MEKLNTRLRVSELSDASLRLARLYQRTSALASDTFLASQFAEIERLGNEIMEAANRDAVLSSLEEADATRDTAVKTLWKVLESYTYSPLQDLRTHAQRLYAVFSKFGMKITRETYSIESALIEALLLDLSATDLETSVSELLGVPEAIALLRDQQNNFAKVRAKYDEALAENRIQRSASDIKKPLLEQINKNVITYLNGMQIVDATTYSDFIAEASQIIESVNMVVKARSVRNQNRETKTR